MKALPLIHDINIPIIGLGTWQLKGNTAHQAVETALEVGYRHIDTADIYGNHSEIGKAIQLSSIVRDELFITSKVWRDNLKKQDVLDSCKRNLDELQLDYLDLYLVHWPNKNISIEETMEALQELKSKKLIRSFGVSNFTESHIQEVLDAGHKSSVNQVEFHPSFYQRDLLEFCKDNNIVLTAYSPLGMGEDMELDIVKQLASKYNALPAQIILSWIMSKEVVVIPKSSTLEHLKQNFDSININLEDSEIAQIDSIEPQKRMLNPGFAEFNN